MSQQNTAKNPAFRAESARPYWVMLGIVILFFSLIHLRLLNIPLERDEGEYAYAGQLILQGIPPYQLAYNMKLPGAYAAYALIMAIFGHSPAGIHLGLLFVNAATVVSIFLLGKRLFNPATGLIAGASYALLSTHESVLGLAAHATHFVVLAALSGILVLLKATDEKKTVLYFASGLLLGLAFVMKQQGVFFALFGGFYLILNAWHAARDWRRIVRPGLAFGIGVAAPFLLTCVILFSAGVLGKMWFWTFSYAGQYASITSIAQGVKNLWMFGSAVVDPCYPLWILAAIGLAAITASRSRRRSGFVIGFLLFSFAGICPGLYFRPHYFVLILPAVSLLIGVAVTSAAVELKRHFPDRGAAAAIPTLMFLIAAIVSIAGEAKVWFQRDPVAVCRDVYGDAPFPEAQAVSEYLRREAAPGARIAVMGSEPEIYFYSGLHSATGYIYMYPLTEDQKYAPDMQKDMMMEVEANHPEYLVVVNVAGSWFSSSRGPTTFIFDWLQKYAEAGYELVGIADRIAPDTMYVWGDAAKRYNVRSQEFIQILKRKNS